MLERVIGNDLVERVVLQHNRAEALRFKRLSDRQGMVKIQHRVWLPIGIEIDVEMVLAPIFSAAQVEFLGELNLRCFLNCACAFPKCDAQNFGLLSLREPLEPPDFQSSTFFFVLQKEKAAVYQGVVGTA